MSETDLQVRLQVAKQAAYIAGEELKRNFRGNWRKTDRQKGAQNADNLSRKAMTTFLGQVYPKEAIAGKNIAPLPQVQDFWVVDSLNGQANYSVGDAHYATVITWIEKRQPVLGVVYNPTHNQMFSVTRGQGSYLNNTKLEVQNTAQVKDAFVIVDFGDGSKRKKGFELAAKLIDVAKQLKIQEAPALDLCAIAAGSQDAFISSSLEPWDWLAGQLVIEEANGVVSDLEGKNLALLSTGIVATNGKVHKELLKAIK